MTLRSIIGAGVVAPLGLVAAAEPLFDVSLSSVGAADLSPYYQRVVREATDRYRGDLGGAIVLYSTKFILKSPIHATVERDHYVYSWTDLPFPADPFGSVTLHTVSPNQEMQPTASPRT